jgi:subtilisin family serine protease
VAVSDTGLDRTHPDLARNVYTNAGEIPDNNIDDDRNGYVDDVYGYNVAENNPDTSDIVGHGTQMSGIIAAEINNQIGISGVSQSKIMPVRFFKKDGPLPEQYNATVADAARSLLYAIAAGADIINASWRTVLDPGQATPQESLALQEAVAATNDAGVVLVCIAGNDGYNLDYSKVYPASYNLSNQIIVAASDFNDEIWHPPFYPYFINTGFGPNTVHLAAPGVSVLTTAARGDCLICSKSENPLEWYARSDGTSISAAYVSGVAALVKSRYPNDSAAIIKRRITEGAEVIPYLNDYVISGRRLSAHGALIAEITISPPVLNRVKYKQGSGKLNLFGSNIKENAQVFVGGKAYTPKPKSEDFSALLVRVPASEFPVGIPVPIIIRNQDGGESQALFYTR